MAPEIGQRYGPYEIQTRLGGGGMGHVYRAWDARLHREVAIKLLHNEFAMPGMRERFLREARAASALNHPNICTVFDIGEQGGEPYLVMELLQGETLKDRILRSTIQVEELVCMAKDVAEALAAAHAKGVVHRDVKPANIFLVNKPNGKVQAKVLDFGLAKIEGGALGIRGRNPDITSAGATVGTLAYMSPEQARGEPLDSRSDLFSLGVVMYEMATKQTPFQGATSALVFVKLLNQAPEPVREWNDAISRDLEKIILKLMAKERTARYQTAGELEQALRELVEKPAGGGWLRKAMSTVPLVRAPDPVARERRAPGPQRGSESQLDVDRQAGDAPPRRNLSGDDLQFFRPVTRLPLDDSASRAAAGALPESVAFTPGLPGGAHTTLPRPVRERYHPDPDELFSLPSRRATEVSTPESEAASSSRGVVRLQAAQEPVAFEELSSPAAGIYELDRVVPEPLPVPQQDDGLNAGGDELCPDPPAPGTGGETRKPRRSRVQRGRLRWIATGGLLVVLAMSAILLVNRGRFRAGLLRADELVVLTTIENRTGDKMLDGGVAQGLHIALAQSRYLRLARSEGYLAAIREGAEDSAGNAIHAHAAAQRMGAKAYLYGRIVDSNVKDGALQGEAAKYTLHVDLMSVANNDVLGSFEEHAATLQQVPGAIDRLADEIRVGAGEDEDSINQTHVALSREATGSLEALHAFTQGEAALAAGHRVESLGFFQMAVALDSHFVQAYLELVAVYRKERAEVAASDAARLALSSSDTTSERTRSLAQYEYEMNASGDYARATALIKRLISDRPRDAEALADLALVLRLQGKLTDSLQVAQQAIAEDAYDLDGYIQASTSLIGLDRYDAALAVDQHAQRLGLAREGGSLIGSYLEDRQDAVNKAMAEYRSAKPGSRPDWSFGLYMDNSGQLTEGLALWRMNAAAAEKVKGLESAGAYLLAQGALDRALVGDCSNALALAHEASALPRGMMALFNAGMSSALCGDRTAGKNAIEELKRVYAQSTDADGYLVADLKAALALNANDPATALEELRATRQSDLISLGPFLRGRAHVALRQLQIGIVDYQTVLSHRGITFIVGSDVYPMAEIGVARAFAETGDLANSGAAYRQFLGLWKSADAGQALVTEARAKAGKTAGVPAGF